MKNFIFFTLLLLLSNPAQAQIEYFNPDMLINDFNEVNDDSENTSPVSAESEEKEIRQIYPQRHAENEDEAQKARNDASYILEQKPNILTLRNSQKRLITEGDEIRRRIKASNTTKTKNIEPFINMQADEEIIETPVAENISQASKNYDSAPFGLFWGISKEQLEKEGIILQPAERKDYTGVYLVTNPQQNADTFGIVTAIFGEQDKLWCIFAQSVPQQDTPQATKVLELYRKYYSALEQKYGNSHEYFTPNSYTEEIINETDANSKPEVVTKTNPIGNSNFLQELKAGTAVLYSTFENAKLGVTLGVSVDGENKSYISIDYKNLKIMEEEQKTKLENLISDI